jgi:release factor glutamine methyltransferase
MEQSRYGSLIRRRADGEPVAYLTGRREFWSIPIEVSRDTLIPRPETELLVEVALCRIPSSRPWHVADLGTGSGAIALAITKERPACHLWATDVSEAALTLARRNAQHHGFGNVEFCQGHWFDPVQGRRFDVILSNPPYVREDDPCLRDGDTRFEPYRALAAGPEGLDAIHLIIRSAGRFLTEGGYLILEHGFDQGEAVKALFAAHGFSELRCHRDLAGHDRVSEGRWRP